MWPPLPPSAPRSEDKPLPLFRAGPLPVTLTPFGALLHWCVPHFLNRQSLLFSPLRPRNTPRSFPPPKRDRNEPVSVRSCTLFPSKLHLEEPGWPCPAPTPLTPTLLPPPGRLQTPRVQRPLTRVPLQTADVRPNQRHGCRGGGQSRRERRLTARWAPPGPSRPHATHGLRPPLPGGGKPGSETGSRDAGEPRG